MLGQQMTIASEFVSFRAADGLVLDGFLVTSPAPKALIVHIHGKGGNFYHNGFLKSMYTIFPASGISMLGLNTRGNGTIVEAESMGRLAYVGSATERLADALLDIKASLAFVEGMAPVIVLQGHSYGCDKIVFAARAGIEAPMILISPADTIALFDRYNEAWADLRQDDELARSVGPFYNIGIRTDRREYVIPMELQSLKNGIQEGDFEVFDLGSADGPAVSNPALVLIGSDDDFQLDQQQAMAQHCLHMLPSATIEICANADHWFANQEEWLARRIASWTLDLAR